MNQPTEHVFLIAFTVRGGTRAEAEDYLHTRLPWVGRRGDESIEITSWWVAEDDRRDGSDNDSAVFVPYHRI